MNRIIQGAREAVAVAKGEEPAAAVWVNGHRYVPEAKLREAVEVMAFLHARLDDLELSWMSDELYRDWAGHVEPAIGRTRAFLATMEKADG